jgi:hypothetical protein
MEFTTYCPFLILQPHTRIRSGPRINPALTNWCLQKKKNGVEVDPSRCHWLHWSFWLVAKLSRDPETRSGIAVRNPTTSCLIHPKLFTESGASHPL